LPTGRTDHEQRAHNVHAVLCVSSASLIWLFLYKTIPATDLVFPYTLAFAAHLAMTGVSRLKRGYPHLPGMVVLPAAILAGWLMLFVPYLLAEGVSDETVTEIFLALGGVALAAVGFFSTQPGMDDCPTDAPRWIRQAMWAGVASVTGLLLITFFYPLGKLR
jgi:hypothetical protein